MKFPFHKKQKREGKALAALDFKEGDHLGFHIRAWSHVEKAWLSVIVAEGSDVAKVFQDRREAVTQAFNMAQAMATETQVQSLKFENGEIVGTCVEEFGPLAGDNEVEAALARLKGPVQ